MTRTAPSTAQITPAPQGFRNALTELVQIGLKVARMVGQSADAEADLAEAAAQAGVAENVSALATSLAEAIQADRAAAAAAEMRQTVVARTAAVASAFARVSRAIRLTILLAERLDRGWVRGGTADDRHTMAKRQIARSVADAITREAEGERAVHLTGALAERLEALDTEEEFGERTAAELIAMICRDLGLKQHPAVYDDPSDQAARQDNAGQSSSDPLRSEKPLDPAPMIMRSALPDTIDRADASETIPLTLGTRTGAAHPPRRQPDG